MHINSLGLLASGIMLVLALVVMVIGGIAGADDFGPVQGVVFGILYLFGAIAYAAISICLLRYGIALGRVNLAVMFLAVVVAFVAGLIAGSAS